MSTPTQTPNAATSTRPGQSSKRVARKAPLGWLPWALLGLLALLLALTFLIINALDDDGPDGPAGDTLGQVDSNGSGVDGQDGDDAVAGAEGAEGGTDGSGETAGGAADGAGGSTPAAASGAALTANGEDLLAASGSSLAARAGQSVEGAAVVQSVVSDEGFWVGPDAAQRVFVFLTPEARQSGGESGFQVRAGQRVALTGVVADVASSPQSVAGVTEAEGRSQLSQQGAFVSAATVELAD